MAHALPVMDDPTPKQRARHALLAKGFRPFFLLAGLFALAIVPSWLLFFFGFLSLDGYLDPASWHAHEMIFGFVMAVVAGFLLTAVGNWAQRETVTGMPLLALSGLWVLGRLAMLWTQQLPYALPAVLDLAFLPLLMAALARPLIATRNLRNYPLLALLGILFVCNAVVHAQALGLSPLGSARRACFVALDAVLLVVSIIIGRVLPMFTRNATQAQGVRSSQPLDYACYAALVVLGVSDAIWPFSATATTSAALAALLTGARARHWGAQHSLPHPLLWVLHAGYAWLVFGLCMRALASQGIVPTSLAAHTFTVGVVGTLTLGMMARVALGHTGRALSSSPSMVVAFIAINLAAAARVLLPLALPSRQLASLWIAGGLWSLAFGLFVVRYAPILSSPRADGKPG